MPVTCAVVISTERLNRDSLDDIPVCLKLPEVGKNPVDTAYDVGSVVSVLADVGSYFGQIVSLWFLLMALDVSGVESMLATLLVPVATDCTIAIICVPGTS
ncbi:hypothetical protein TNCV_4118901 [Trichonephila clavipes]|nr:hypothetical protein TNCV_4118901 [Trichonephila clavipes]